MLMTDLFYHIDEFCKTFENEIRKNSLPTDNFSIPKGALCLSEIMTIEVYFHYSGYKTFKDYFLKYEIALKQYFPKLTSYSRFTELQQQILLPMALLARIGGANKCNEVSFIDSFPLAVCHIKRASGNKTFKDLAKKGKTSVGWFFGFKVHLVISTKGEIIDFCITPGNVADNNLDVVNKITQNIVGKLIGDKGYISPKLFESLFSRQIKLITKIRQNMKNKLMDFYEKLLLKKRGLIESVIDILKNSFSIEHSRHRSPINFLSNVFSAIVAYSFRLKKPSIHLPLTRLQELI